MTSQNKQFVVHDIFEEQKLKDFTDTSRQKHQCIVQVYNRLKYCVQKKVSAFNVYEDKRKHSSINYQQVIERLRKRRSVIVKILQKRTKDLKKFKGETHNFKVSKYCVCMCSG